MNLHITPSFIIDRLCKTASVLLFLVSRELFRNYELIIRKNVLIIRKNELIIRKYEIIIRNYE